MSDNPVPESSFLTELIAVIEKNIANEQFGVSELADEMNMSRSNLLRKVKKESKLSVSQLISQVRLKRAMELLRKTSANVSEVSHQVGFNSTSYFIKCFREYYGYPPGEVGKRGTNEPVETGKLPESTQGENIETKNKSSLKWVIAGVAVVVLGVAVYLFWGKPDQLGFQEEKSIAVLPFKNDSNDSTNLYLINGLTESTLNKLQQIKNLRVISRTSVEKYRNSSKTIPEMGKELNVKYFVEGSGQKMGDRILLNIQLIEAATDKHLWSKQYRREAKDIFDLQEEIARNITEEIEVFITPEEKNRIEKRPTEDLVAYDYFLKGAESFRLGSHTDLEASVKWLNKAIERDPKFSRAYATVAMVYYYLDIFNFQKLHTADIDNCAEKAILYDAQSSESMVAKALSFAQKGQYELSLPYFEKALDYDPRSGLVLHFLVEFYNIHVPNPPKYLEYAIRKADVDKTSDSTTASFAYFHLSYALLQNGFLDESLRYNEKCLRLDPKSFFGGFVNDYIHYAIERDPQKARDRLLTRWKRDTTRFDILQEAGKMSAMMRDYKTAVSCYDRSLATMKLYGLDIMKHEFLRMADAYDKTGQKQKGIHLVEIFKDYADRDMSMYKNLHLMGYYAYLGDNDKAITYLKQFAQPDHYIYWLLLMRNDPMMDNLKKHPDFDAAMKEIELGFQKQREEMKERWEFEFRDM